MTGNLLGLKGTLPNIYTSLSVKFYLMKHLLGASKENQNDGVQKIKKITA
jgi:translation initiation factor 2 gamma subunit (eIF-2gamma)